MKTVWASVVAVLFLTLGACGDNGSSSLDSTPMGDGAVSIDAPAGDASAGDTLAGDAPAGDKYCPVVGYSACGGDLIGTWAFRALCPEDPAAAAALCEHPYDDKPVCTGTGNEAVCDGTQTGTLTFKSDGTVDVDTQLSLVTKYNFTDECLAAAVTTGTTAKDRCLAMSNDKLSCVYESRCTCVSEPMVESDKNTGTYKIVGQDSILGEDPPATYCIDGDRLTMDYYAFHPVSWRYWVLERQ